MKIILNMNIIHLNARVITQIIFKNHNN